MRAHYAVREDIRIDLSTQEKWQRNLDLFADVMGVPTTLIVRAHEDHLEVYARSAGQDRSYLEGQLFSPREGQYFEAVLESRKMLLVPDARLDRHWASSLDAAMGLVACLGIPILWPSGEVFGAICALDTKARAFTDQEQKFLGMCADGMRDDLANLIVQTDLQKALAEQIIIGQSLRETEERFEKAFRASVTGIMITTFRDGVILDANEAYLKLLGYRYEELIGRPTTEMDIYLTPEDRTKILQKLLKDGIVRNQELQLRAKTGEIKSVQCSIQRIETMGRDHLITTFYDLTTLKNLECESKLLHERHALALRAAQAGVWDWDIPNNALWWDDQMYRLYDVARDEFGGTYEAWLARLHPDDRARSEAEARKAILGEKEYDTEFRILRSDGRVRTIKAYGDIIRDGDGGALRVVGINMDITERKQVER